MTQRRRSILGLGHQGQVMLHPLHQQEVITTVLTVNHSNVSNNQLVLKLTATVYRQKSNIYNVYSYSVQIQRWVDVRTNRKCIMFQLSLRRNISKSWITRLITSFNLCYLFSKWCITFTTTILGLHIYKYYSSNSSTSKHTVLTSVITFCLRSV